MSAFLGDHLRMQVRNPQNRTGVSKKHYLRRVSGVAAAVSAAAVFGGAPAALGAPMPGISPSGYHDRAAKTPLTQPSGSLGTNSNPVIVKVQQPPTSPGSELIGLLPVLLIGGVMFIVIRNMAGASKQGQGVLNFAKSKRHIKVQKPKDRFADVAGIDEALAELVQIRDMLADPKKYQALGAKVPRGVLLVGPPGTGKTLMARAVAGETDASFFSMSASEFVEMFVGVGAKRLRVLFEEARKDCPSIVFIDEIDALGKHRTTGVSGGNDEREQTLNQLLTEMDGFDGDDRVIVIGATNRPQLLDEALTRPGRFDRTVHVALADMKGRHAQFAVHCKGKPVDSDVDLEVLARATPGASGADIAHLVNEAAIIAADQGQKTITQANFLESIDRLQGGGRERKSQLMSPLEQNIVTYHEAGHALVAHLTPGADPVRKISIVPRGQAGGVTIMIPEEETKLWSQDQLQAKLDVAHGGRAAEAIMLGSITGGASNDFDQARNLATVMVTKFGMGKLGDRSFGDFDGMSAPYSQATQARIDREVDRILQESMARATKLIRENKAAMEAIANGLREHQALDEKQFRDLIEPLLGKRAQSPDAGGPELAA